MRKEQDLQFIINAAEAKEGTDKEGELKGFLDGIDLNQETKDRLWSLAIEASNENAELGIISGLRYAKGDDDWHVESFIDELGVSERKHKTPADLIDELKESSRRQFISRNPDIFFWGGAR